MRKVAAASLISYRRSDKENTQRPLFSESRYAEESRKADAANSFILVFPGL